MCVFGCVAECAHVIVDCRDAWEPVSYWVHMHPRKRLAEAKGHVEEAISSFMGVQNGEILAYFIEMNTQKNHLLCEIWNRKWLHLVGGKFH